MELHFCRLDAETRAEAILTAVTGPKGELQDPTVGSRAAPQA